LFSSQQVARSKPSPDIYIYAAEKMGVTPEVALVIEDSISGVIAACAAGATVIFLRHRKPGARQQRHALNLAGSTACRNAIDSRTLV
jgi:beta-phosphoglucomutase-like phosphatase (HAD superfamily)